MFRKILKNYRNLLKLTQQEVADKLKVSRQCYSGYEQGTREPNFDILRKLCIIFNCTSDELLEIETEIQRNRISKDINN